MKHNKYRVYFQNDVVTVYALTVREAAILGMADKIKKGENYSIEKIVNEHGQTYTRIKHLRFTLSNS